LPTTSIQRIPAPPSPVTLIDRLLAEQGTLGTPAARFAEIHDRTPDLADHYRQLIPLTKPAAGEQYAFEVSLDRCTGCKACVSACHSLNGLDDHEAWRDTGVLSGGVNAPGWQQTITTACHHCEDPGCMNGCPVGAYEKDADTGIVRHLDDQCIGCSYCILKCPYDVPKYSKKRGIVRKCDMCHERLAEGEAPACVQACPTEAIRIVKVRSQGAGDRSQASNLFNQQSAINNHESSIPDFSITRPTTRYVGREVPATAFAADRDQLIPQHTHWPLVLMLVFTQAGIGLLGAASIHSAADTNLIRILGAVLFNAGMAAATLHLGQPLKAWRFFLGLRTSWLSREILAFSLFAPIPLLLCVLPWVPAFPLKQEISLVTSLSVLPVGAVAIFTSVMIYHDTRRSLWRFPLGAIRFFGTAITILLIGLAIPFPGIRLLAAFAILLKMIPEARMLRSSGQEDLPWTPDCHSARLQLGPLRGVLNSRFIFAFIAAYVVLVEPWIALPILLASEILERVLFFKSVQAPKMPGTFGVSTPHG
jgi:formate dehydrogenase iron-sulfur subunit